jgi:hypothetical protein
LIYKIYRLIDPRDNSIHYVGRTSGCLIERLAEHTFEVSTRTTSGTKSRPEKIRWFTQLMKLNLVPKIELICNCISKKESIEKEFKYTLLYKLKGYILYTNMIKISSGSLKKLIKDLPSYTNHALSLKYKLDKKTIKKIRYLLH